jgi:molecular chaperone DnaK (HSP70)
MDASVIQIKDGKDFQIISNIGDNSFGLNDVNERLVKYIVHEKTRLSKSSDKMLSPRSHNEVLNPHSKLIEGIKTRITFDGQAALDLTSMAETNLPTTSKGSQKNTNVLVISKSQIMESICKDVYDWSMVHVDKAEKHADLQEGVIDEIIVIGGPEKMPGFFDQLQKLHPNKKITFVTDGELSVGAAIVVKIIPF